MTKTPRPLHQPGDCEQVMADGRLCHHWAMFIMTRIDGAKVAYCTRHANAIREQREARPDLFNPVTFSTVRSADLTATSKGSTRGNGGSTNDE